ncbi:MAG TPA: hypothetical protein VH333_00190, partial [Pseudonocardiaceae bacterium]|nr:hypothetical protein [Pseudonocardiaceae bacterium]
ANPVGMSGWIKHNIRVSTDGVATVPNEQRLPVRKLSTAEAAKYADLVSIAQDLWFVVQACNRLRTEMVKAEDHQDPVVARSLWTAALIAYSRCFENTRRKGLAVADVRALPLQGEVVEWHDFLRSMRSKHIAHSVNSFEMISIGAIEGTSGTAEGVVWLSLQHHGVEDGGIDQTATLAGELHKVVTARIEQHSHVVLDEAKTLTPSQLGQLPDLRADIPGNEVASSARPVFTGDNPTG